MCVAGKLRTGNGSTAGWTFGYGYAGSTSEPTEEQEKMRIKIKVSMSLEVLGVDGPVPESVEADMELAWEGVRERVEAMVAEALKRAGPEVKWSIAGPDEILDEGQGESDGDGANWWKEE